MARKEGKNKVISNEAGNRFGLTVDRIISRVGLYYVFLLMVQSKIISDCVL